MQAIIIRQAVLQPGLQSVEAIRLDDGNKGGSVRSLCALLDLSRQGQVQRIKRTPELAPALIQVSVATPAGPRLFDVLLAYAIPDAWQQAHFTSPTPATYPLWPGAMCSPGLKGCWVGKLSRWQ